MREQDDNGSQVTDDLEPVTFVAVMREFFGLLWWLVALVTFFLALSKAAEFVAPWVTHA